MRPSGIELDRRGALLAVLAVALVSVYQAMFFLAPGALAVPLWRESALTLAFLLGNLSLAVPVAFSWWMIAADAPDGETFDTSHH